MITIFIFLSSGLFLGWSLGANDAANVFGTAVGTKMISFRRNNQFNLPAEPTPAIDMAHGYLGEREVGGLTYYDFAIQVKSWCFNRIISFVFPYQITLQVNSIYYSAG